jgi:hypothetical protein
MHTVRLRMAKTITLVRHPSGDVVHINASKIVYYEHDPEWTYTMLHLDERQTMSVIETPDRIETLIGDASRR